MTVNGRDVALPRYYTVADVARILEISLTSAYALVRSGKIRAFRVGNQYRVPKCALDELEETGTV